MRRDKGARVGLRRETRTIVAPPAPWYPFRMTTVREIEDAVTRLPGSDLDEFRAWFARFDAEAWDREFDKDARNGKLDRLADRALADLAQGRCTGL